MFNFINPVRLTLILMTLFLCFGIAVSQTDDIYYTDMQTGITSRLTWLNETGEYNPNWSPCGQFIVHDVKGESVPFGHSAFITDVSTGTSHLLLGAEGGNDPSWSPDGKWIVFDRDPPFGDPPDDQTLYIVSSTGGERRIVCTDAVNADWSPESKRLVFSRPSDGGIYTIDTDGSNELFVIYGYCPVWSPDGQWIAFELEGDLFKVKVDPMGKPHPLVMRQTKGPWWDGSPSWSSDSKMLAFHSDFNYDFDIWTVETGHNRPDIFAGKEGFGEYDPSFSKSGFKIAYSGFTENSMLYRQSPLGSLTGQPSAFSLKENYPDPFNPKTRIGYALPVTCHLDLSVYNILGQKLCTLVSENQTAGSYEVEWDANDLPTGIYIYTLSTDAGFNQTRKMVLMK